MDSFLEVLLNEQKEIEIEKQHFIEEKEKLTKIYYNKYIEERNKNIEKLIKQK